MEHDVLGTAHRLLGWIDSNHDRIGSQLHARNTPQGLTAHLTDDPNTLGDTSIETVVGHLIDLADKGLVQRNPDGTYSRTAEGDRVLGGVVHAESNGTMIGATDAGS